MQSISCKYVDIIKREIYPAVVEYDEEKIRSVIRIEEAENVYLIPGLVDAHIHIESSMLIPQRFAEEALKHGTIATISDPHEIANVCGLEGIEFMIENGRGAPFYFYFGAPSCVPATGFETSGAEIDSEKIYNLLQREEIYYLSEMMNYPGVIFDDPEVMAKIESAKKLKMKIDGHAPGLRGEKLRKYVSAGISTDHECFSYEEAREKAELGMKILIREGSAAKNYPALRKIISEFPERVMFCSDDKHPDDLLKGHINKLLARALKDGFDFWDVLRAATYNPVRHYGLNHGLAQPGDPSNFVLISDPEEFEVEKVFIAGHCVMENKRCKFQPEAIEPINNFYPYDISSSDLEHSLASEKLRIIEARDGELITGSIVETIRAEGFVSDIDRDILKIVVVNRYRKSKPAIAWIRNFGLKKGAIASTVAHDSHNIICVGVNDESICKAVNELMRIKGGIVVFDSESCDSLQLPVGGLMSDRDAEYIGKAYEKLDLKAKQLGSKLTAPFMTLSFMALLVIPELKLSDKGLFNGVDFKFESLDAS